MEGHELRAFGRRSLMFLIQNVNGSSPTGGSPPVRALSRKLVYEALVDPRK